MLKLYVLQHEVWVGGLAGSALYTLVTGLVGTIRWTSSSGLARVHSVQGDLRFSVLFGWSFAASGISFCTPPPRNLLLRQPFSLGQCDLGQCESIVAEKAWHWGGRLAQDREP